MHFAVDRISQNLAFQESLKIDQEKRLAEEKKKEEDEIAMAVEASLQVNKPKNEKELREARIAFFNLKEK